MRDLFLTVFVLFAVYAGLLLIIGHPLAVAGDGVSQEAQVIKLEEKAASQTETRDQMLETVYIVGVSGQVELDDKHGSIDNLWETLMQDSVLINNVNWSDDDINVYAYYDQFNENLTRARLHIGFDVEALLVNTSAAFFVIEKGRVADFPLDDNSSLPSNQAWASAMMKGNLLEQYTLDSSGEIKEIKVVVLERGE